MIPLNIYHYIVICVSHTPEDSENEKIIDYILSILEISRESVTISREVPIDNDSPVLADIVIEDTIITYYIEIKKRLSVQALSQITLYQALIRNETPEKKAVFIIAASVIPSEFHTIAEKTGIKLIQLPHPLVVSQKNLSPTSKGKITADKSWRVVTRLLKEKCISIRQISIQEKISYGLAHKVIQELLESHIATKEEYCIRISDISPLLNIIAWERNMKKLQQDEFWLPHDQAHAAAQELSQVGENQGIWLVFNSFTAAGLYTGYAQKHDEVHLYMQSSNLSFLKNTYSGQKGAVRAVVYRPDREIMTNSRIIEGVRVTSPAQTLLDIAGMGYSGITLAKKMVEIFDRL